MVKLLDFLLGDNLAILNVALASALLVVLAVSIVVEIREQRQ